jgi:5-methyltetrahydropteroyltriglutamate--homocysteine methyltransferase
LGVYRAENVGSLLRPPYLLEAREQHADRRLAELAFKRIEDRAVDEAVGLQERVGLDVLTDGELRRNVFASQLIQASEGFEAVAGNTVDWFRMDGGTKTSPVSVGLTGPIRRKRHLCAEEFAYLRGRTSRPTKITIPAPTMFAYYWVPGVSDAAYPSTDAYLEEITQILRDEVEELVRLGAEYIQVDAPEFGMLIDPHQRDWFAGKGFDPDRLIHDGVDMINAVLADARVLTGLHVCRGNDANRFMARGGYERIAPEVFGRSQVDVLLLGYDDDRSGDFSSLVHVPDDKIVVLGLISTKRRNLEHSEALRTRIHEATRYVPLERLALSTQCGFASVAIGNDLSPEEQEEKLRLVVSVSREVRA